VNLWEISEAIKYELFLLFRANNNGINPEEFNEIFVSRMTLIFLRKKEAYGMLLILILVQLEAALFAERIAEGKALGGC
jgi:hypothetical protein